MNTSKPDANERLSAMLARSSTDLEFRSKLLAHPRQTMSEFLGVDLPETYSIAVVENKADQTIVLPDPVAPGGEISERELEAVAGGCTIATGTVILSVIQVSAAAIDFYNHYQEHCGN
jgi:hypothetical protein